MAVTPSSDERLGGARLGRVEQDEPRVVGRRVPRRAVHERAAVSFAATAVDVGLAERVLREDRRVGVRSTTLYSGGVGTVRKRGSGGMDRQLEERHDHCGANEAGRQARACPRRESVRQTLPGDPSAASGRSAVMSSGSQREGTRNAGTISQSRRDGVQTS